MPLIPALPPSQDTASAKSLTPQRKHRKLLKDGSGAEVWPESIEKIFVQGLREYWNSPYATYPQSRGRSRWRNQFLVDYLQKHNITRSKKQVASHIQVLRNMWKGEPEYQLVAGGEELMEASPPAGSKIKLEDQWTNGLIPIEFEDTDGYSSNSTSPDFSPPDFQNQFLPSPDSSSTRQLDVGSNSPFTSAVAHGLVASPTPYVTSFTNSPHDYSSFSGAYDKYGQVPPVRTISMDGSAPTSGYPKPQQYSNRIRALRLTADGMSPFIIRTDPLVSPNSPYEPLQLKIRLSISTMDDINCPPALHGFLASICLSQIWASSGKCITKAIAGNTTISEDMGPLEVSEITAGIVNAVLPESYLNRCRWLDPHTPTSITQEIIIDDVSLLFVIYELDRASGNPMPSAQFTGFLKYPTTRNGLGSGTTASVTTSPSARPYSLSPSSTGSAGANRGFSTPTGNSTALSASSNGYSAVPSPVYHHPLHHQSGSMSQHSTPMTMSGSGASGAGGASGLAAYPLPIHSHHVRHPSQTLAHALTPVRYAMATSLPS